jgi:hypothetical protein
MTEEEDIMQKFGILADSIEKKGLSEAFSTFYS